jgi:hypothetical protein
MGPGSAGFLQALPASMLTKLCRGLSLPDATPAAEAMAAIGSVGKQLSALQQLRYLNLHSYETSCFEDIEESVRQQDVLVPVIRCLTNLTFLYLLGESVSPSYALACVSETKKLGLEHRPFCCDYTASILTNTSSSIIRATAAIPVTRTTSGVQPGHDERVTILKLCSAHHTGAGPGLLTAAAAQAAEAVRCPLPR